VPERVYISRSVGRAYNRARVKYYNITHTSHGRHDVWSRGVRVYIIYIYIYSNTRIISKENYNNNNNINKNPFAVAIDLFLTAVPSSNIFIVIIIIIITYTYATIIVHNNIMMTRRERPGDGVRTDDTEVSTCGRLSENRIDAYNAINK
jgi:hypothetical protein